MRLIATASRSWDRRDVIWQCLDILAAQLAAIGEQHLVVAYTAAPPSKAGPSGDMAIAAWTNRAIKPAGIKVRLEPHPAKGNTFRRNQRMVDLGASLCLAFQRGGSGGVGDVLERAEKAEIVTKTLKYEHLGTLFAVDFRQVRP